MVRPKKQSKRMTCHKKYKIIKKVKEHHRKARKEEKKTGNKKKTKKDPGIPNLFPFKEQVLRQIEERKQRAEEEKDRRKEKRQKEISKRRKLEDLKKSAEKRSADYEKKHSKTSQESNQKGGVVENSMKSYYKEFKKVVDAADVVIEVLDARDPLGCRCTQLEQMVMASSGNKRVVLLLNKIDLVPKDIVEKWLKYLRHEFPTLAFKASTQSQRQKLKQSKITTNMASSDLLNSSSCIGAGTLLKLLGNYCRNKDIKTAITVGIVGFPNVGKSSVINSLKRSRVCTVGGTPGVTKSLQEIQLDKHVKLLDSPGIVMPTGSTNTQIILRNCVKLEQLDDVVTPVDALLKRCNKMQMMEKYFLPEYKNSQEFLYHLATRLGKLRKGGIPDITAAAKAVLKDWNSGRITFYTHPPERKVDENPNSSQVVQYLASEFNMAALLKEEEDDLKDLMTSLSTALVLDPGKPSEMQTEETEAGGSEEDNVEDSDFDDLENDDEEEEMLEDDEDNQLQNVQVVINKKGGGELKTVSEKVKDDGENLQVNQQSKKAFKQMQKQKRKEEAKLISQAEDKMAVGDSDDDYDFAAVL